MEQLDAQARLASRLTERLRAALAPLRFAARNDFAQLQRVRELEPTLTRALRVLHADADASDTAPTGEAEALLALLPPAGATPSARVAQLRQVLARLEAWQARLDLATAGGGSQQGAATAVQRPARASTGLAPRQEEPDAAAGPRAQDRPARAPARQVASKKSAEARLTPAADRPSATDAQKAAPPAAKRPAAATAPLEGELVPQLDQALQFLRGVGPRTAEGLASRQLNTVSDLLHFFPRRYQGRTGGQTIAELVPDTVASVEGQVQRVADRFVRGRHSLEVVLADPTGSLHLVWFRVPGRSFAAQFRQGSRFRAAGTVKRYRQALQIAHPEVRQLEDLGIVPEALPAPSGAASVGPGSADDVVPLYLEIDGVHPGQLRRIVATALPALVHLEDPLPQALRTRRELVTLAEALRCLHVPPADADVLALESQSTPWHRRLIYDECFYLQLGLLYRRHHEGARRNGVALPASVHLPALAAKLLPFTLTDAQSRALADVAADLHRPEPMQRLLQGDVGSGKTAVALTAAAAVAQAGLQAAVMAPTELLAEQHARTFRAALAPHGIEVLLHTGQQSSAERRGNLAAIASGAAQVIIGTHALIQTDVQFARLALAIVDEQHRFGVMQRARLSALGEAGLGRAPHVLVMTATPIPRTLALTVYGDLELSLIDALPPGRTPVATKLFSDGQRAQVFAAVRDEVAAGRQAYVVFPLVEHSDKEGMGELRAATEQADELAAGVLHGLRLGLLHGRLSREEKEAVMQAFLRRDVDVLVATTVIEVGIDVPNATVMVIEHAERFGLSQLHQLRGRVGRGAAKSHCYLLARFRPSQTAWRRLAIMEQTNDGFRIAEEDLAIRGPGDFIGTRQSGLPVLSMTNLARDGALLVQAREDARALLANDPQLQRAPHALLRRRLGELWQQRLQLARLA